jgi:hypothetical protein
LAILVDIHPALKTDFELALADYPLLLSNIVRDFTVCIESQGQCHHD